MDDRTATTVDSGTGHVDSGGRQLLLAAAAGKAAWRLMPVIMICYMFAYFDRIIVSFAKFQLQEDLSLSDTAYGIGAGLFSLSYVLCEVPSNLFLYRVGARRWIARIMVTWGIWVDSRGRRNTLTEGVAMRTGRRRSDRALRAVLPRSPGRPGVAQRENRRRFWAAIAAGRSSEAAAIEAGVSPAVGARWFREAGGMSPKSLAPSAKPPSGRYLVFAEREEIALGRAQGQGIREIARRLGRAASTISRELRRNAATRSGGLAYRASTAQWHAERAARRPKGAKLATTAALRTYVQERLSGAVATPGGAAVVGPAVAWKGRRHGRRQPRRWAKAWSPEQIARRLRIDFPGDETMRISHEAIYQALYVQGRGALRRELTACLRTGRALRVPRARSRRAGKGFVDPAVLISQRPAEAADRAVPGHWEGDLIVGLGSSAIGTLVERTTRFTMLLHLPRMDGHGFEARTKNGPALAGHGAEAVRDAITRAITTLPEQLRRSLTWDRGAEMAQHAQLRIEAGVAVYFCDPHSPWQRGTNENTNGLLRQYFPKGTDLSVHSAEDLAAVAAALNGRPRKTLGWRTPAEAFDELLRSAHIAVATTA
jgi:IS30 family transposase